MSRIAEEWEAKDMILRYLLDNRGDGQRIGNKQIHRELFPNQPIELVNHLLLKIWQTADPVLDCQLRNDTPHNHEVFYRATEYTQAFLEGQGGYTALHEKQEQEQKRATQKENLDHKLAKWKVVTFWPLFAIAILGGIPGIVGIGKELISHPSHSDSISVETLANDSIGNGTPLSPMAGRELHPTGSAASETREAQRRDLLERLESEGGPTAFDSLLDLSFDGNEDYVVGWYGGFGNGLRWSWSVYLWDSRTSTYRMDSIISGKPNPSFFPEEKKLTTFYLTNGGGEGEELEWAGSHWQSDMKFVVENKGAETDWRLTYPTTGRTKTLRLPYSMPQPPKEILKHHYGH